MHCAQTMPFAAADRIVSRLKFFLCGLLIGAVFCVDAQTLRPGPGADLTAAKCAICHEVQHVTRSALTRAEWQDNLDLMKLRGLQIGDDEYQRILNYLTTYYGTTPAPAANATPSASASSTTTVVKTASQLLNEHACLSCHAVDSKVIGPAYKEVAKKYAGDSTARAHLVRKLRQGGKGVWGSIEMPGNSTLTEEEIARLVDYVLSLK